VATNLEELDSMSGIDMNNDGKPDIIVGEIFGAQRVIVYENVNNGASWTTHVVDSGKESHNGARVVDLNNDGRPDIVSIAYNSYAYLHVWLNDATAAGRGSGKEITSQPPPLHMPISFALHQNYPNPFNPSTTIRYDVPTNTHVRLTIFDIMGREIARLVDDLKESGAYEAHWDATNVASGVYICRIDAGVFSESVKLVLLR
jgi:hypothetical protein